MNTQLSTDRDTQNIQTKSNRERLLADIPVTEYKLDCAGISTAILEGGAGPPIILLHGPGETAIWWMRVIPKLVSNHHVIVPDLPGHGSSKVDSDELDTDLVFNWFTELIKQTCPSPPIVAGNIIGGSIAARYAVNHGEQIDRLVLVNSLGLGKFRPAVGFAYRLIRFMVRPTKKNYDRFLPQCMYDADDLRTQMGSHWEPFLNYNLECARDPDRKSALRILMQHIGTPKIAPEDLDKINIPTALIWGRHDRANKLHIAESASKRYGWPLHIIEEARDDPKLERPEAFVNVLNSILETDEPINKQ